MLNNYIIKEKEGRKHARWIALYTHLVLPIIPIKCITCVIPGHNNAWKSQWIINNKLYNGLVSCDFQMQKLFEELESHFREEQEKTKLEVCM